MELLRNWIIGVTSAALLVAVADSITPPGAVKKIGKLTGGVVLMIAVLSPFVGLNFGALSLALAESRGAYSEYSAQEADILSAQLMKTIIEEQSGAYISDKANEIGAECSVRVVCKIGEENLPYPSSVTVTGALSQEQRQTLTRIIESDLAIPSQMQTYESGDVK